MKRRTRTEITVETSLLVIRRGTNQAQVWCNQCLSPVQWITPEQAGVLAGVNTRTVYRWVDVEQLHFIEMIEQAPRICLNSLLKATEKRRKCHATEDMRAPEPQRSISLWKGERK